MKKRFQLAFFATALVALGSVPALAVNLLTGGDFELDGSEIAGWTLEEFASGTGAVLNTAELKPWSDKATSGTWVLWVIAPAGGQELLDNGDHLTNAILSQTVPGNVGESYTFTGDSRWEANYSGSYDNLFAGPLSGEPSPTQTNMELAFLNAGGAVIGTPVTLDLRTEQNNFGDPATHTLVGQAPAGTVSVRVTAEARDMVFHTDPAQSAFYDTFSLTGAGSPGTQLLANPDLEDPQPDGLEDWTITVDPDNDEIIRTAGFANHPPDGTRGVWLSSWIGQPGAEVDGTLSQAVPGVVGGDYTFSGWSRWEDFYSGGQAGTPTETFMELAFLDGSDVVIGDPISLDLRDEQMNDGEWRQHTLNGVAPAGTANVRVSAGLIDGLHGGGDPQSAFFDDFVLELAADFEADFDNDGDVDGNDFLLWQSGFPTPSGAVKMDGDADNDGDVDGNDFLIWQTEFPSPGSGAGSSAVPEPGTGVLALLAAGLLTIGRRRTT